MQDPAVRLSVDGSFAAIVIDRPAQRNALTLAMYDDLVAACRQIEASAHRISLVTISGTSGSFAAGTDIAEFTSFTGGADGLRYEQRIDEVLRAVEALPMTTCAVVDGPAMGGGCLLAACCDFRLVTPRAKFGAPMARTLGNCLSGANLKRLVSAVGYHATRRMLLLAEIIDADEAVRSGFALSCVESPDVEAEIARVAGRLEQHAPLTIAATKKMLGTISAGAEIEDSEILDRVYGSEDFAGGVAAFLNKRTPAWRGS